VRVQVVLNETFFCGQGGVGQVSGLFRSGAWQRLECAAQLPLEHLLRVRFDPAAGCELGLDCLCKEGGVAHEGFGVWRSGVSRDGGEANVKTEAEAMHKGGVSGHEPETAQVLFERVCDERR
jgi:hypothetical protein